MGVSWYALLNAALEKDYDNWNIRIDVQGGERRERRDDDRRRFFVDLGRSTDRSGIWRSTIFDLQIYPIRALPDPPHSENPKRGRQTWGSQSTGLDDRGTS